MTSKYPSTRMTLLLSRMASFASDNPKSAVELLESGVTLAEFRLVKRCGSFQAFPEPFLLIFFGAAAQALFRKFHTCSLCEIFQRLWEVHILDLLVEAENVAAGLADEAVGDAFVWRDQEARVRIIMKRADRFQCSPF